MTGDVTGHLAWCACTTPPPRAQLITLLLTLSCRTCACLCLQRHCCALLQLAPMRQRRCASSPPAAVSALTRLRPGDAAPSFQPAPWCPRSVRTARRPRPGLPRLSSGPLLGHSSPIRAGVAVRRHRRQRCVPLTPRRPPWSSSLLARASPRATEVRCGTWLLAASVRAAAPSSLCLIATPRA